MPFVKGQPKVGGRQNGTINKNSAALKDMILGALSEAGGQAYLVQQAKINPGPFLTLVGKVLPTTLEGDKANPIAVSMSFEEERREAIDAIRAAFAEPAKQ